MCLIYSPDVFYVLDMSVLNTTTILRAIKKKQTKEYLIPRLPLELPRDKACIYISLGELVVNLTHCVPPQLHRAHLQCLSVTSVCAPSFNDV